MIRKIMIFVLCSVMVLSLAACGTKKEESVSIKDADIYSEYKIEESAVKEKQDFSQDGITVTVGDITYEDVTTKINMHVKNAREETVTVSTANLSINGLMSNDTMLLTLDAKTEKDSYIQISNEWFGQMNIETIKIIEFVIKVFDEKNDEIMKSDVLTIKTDAPWTYRQKYDDEGVVLYDDNGITLAVREVQKSALSNDMELVFYAENKTNKAISIMCDDVSVNGTPIEPLFVITVGAKKKAVDSMLFYENDMTEGKITEFKNVKASFKAFDENLETVFETEILEVPIN